MFKYIKNQIINLVNKNQPKEFGEYFNNAYHTPKDIYKDIIKNIQYWLNEEEPRCKQVKFKVAEPVYGTDGCILKVDIKVYIKDGYAKLLLGLAKGKHDYDKRESIKRREQNRDIARVMKAVNQ